MEIVSRAKAEVVLKPHIEAFWKCIQLGWSDYLKSYSGVRAVHEARTRANLVRDHIVSHAREEFIDRSGTQVIEKDGTFFVAVDKRFLVRFKKLNEHLQSSNYPTYQQLCFARQMTIPGFFPSATYLVAGYVPNNLWTEIQSAYITCSRNENLEWYLRIDQEPAYQPVVEITPQQGSVVPFRRVRPKGLEAGHKKAEKDEQ